MNRNKALECEISSPLIISLICIVFLLNLFNNNGSGVGSTNVLNFIFVGIPFFFALIK